jgi:hypothetical protein
MKERSFVRMDIPYPLLKEWHSIVYGSNNKPNSSQTSQPDTNSDRPSPLSSDPTSMANP